MKGIQIKQWFVALLIIFCFSILLHLHYFIPTERILSTPEFELNDAIQGSYAPKYWLWQKLHTHEQPLWSKDIGMGHPMLGEGVAGIFFLQDRIIYSVAPSAFSAFTISRILTFFLTAFGMYIWLSLIGISFIIALISGITFALSGFFLFHEQHIIVIQAFSFFPWILAATHELCKKIKLKYSIFLAFLMSQQFCTGFYQSVVITGIAALTYALCVCYKEKSKGKIVFLFLLALVLVLLLSGIQLIPNIEYFTQILEAQSSNEFSTYFSFPLKSFLTFLSPFILGSPKDGSYFNQSTDAGTLFWETNGYVGILPLVTLILSCVIVSIRKKILPFLILILVGTILMLGKFSPFYFLFDFPPLSMFRVPARFVIFVSFALVSICAIVATRLLSTTKIRLIRFSIFFLLCLNCVSLVPLWLTYHDTQTISSVHEAPDINSSISKGEAAYRLSPSMNHRHIFTTEGWLHPEKYTIFKNALRPHTNVFWGIRTFDPYVIRTIKNYAYADSVMKEGIDVSSETVATTSASAQKYLSLSSVSKIVSGYPINSDNNFPLEQTISDGTTNIYLYDIPSSNDSIYIADRLEIVHTLNDAITVLSKPTFEPSRTALVNSLLFPDTENDTLENIATTVSWKDTEIKVVTETTVPQSLLVIANSFYPGWTATIDGKPAPILETNIRFMGVVIPKGKHEVRLTYAPTSLLYGAYVTTFGILLIGILFLFRKKIDRLWI